MVSCCVWNRYKLKLKSLATHSAIPVSMCSQRIFYLFWTASDLFLSSHSCEPGWVWETNSMILLIK